jgi:hypothetical protein
MNACDREDRAMAALAEASKLVARLHYILDRAWGDDRRKIELIRKAVAEYVEAAHHHRPS